MTAEVRTSIEDKIYVMACQVILAAHGKNEFFTHEAAVSWFNGMVEIAKEVGFTNEDIERIKTSAKVIMANVMAKG